MNDQVMWMLMSIQDVQIFLQVLASLKAHKEGAVLQQYLKIPHKTQC